MKLTNSRSWVIVKPIVRKSAACRLNLVPRVEYDYGNSSPDNIFFIVTRVIRLYCCIIFWKYYNKTSET